MAFITSIKRTIAFATTAALAASSMFAVEWGGLVGGDGKFYNNSEKFKGGDNPTIEATADASLWLRIPFSASGENYLITEGKYEFEHDHNIDGRDESDNTQYLDLSLFKLVFLKHLSTGDSAKEISLSLGRFYLSDLSGKIFTQNADGLLAKYNSTFLGLSLYGSYTGLLNGRAVSMLSCEDEDTYHEDNDKLYEFAERYVVGSVSASLNNLFLNQTLCLEGFGTFRAEDESYNRMYGTLSISGPAFANTYYSVSSTLGYTAYDGDDDKIKTGVGNMTTGRIAYFTSFKDATFGLSGLFASDKFNGFTSNTAIQAQNEEQVSGILLAGPFGTIKPTASVLVNASAEIACDSHRGDEKDSFGLAGMQFKGGIAYQPFSDLSIKFSAVQFIDFDESENNKTTLELAAALTF